MATVSSNTLTSTAHGKDTASSASTSRYRRVWLYSALSTAFVSLMPLVVMTFVNYHQYKESLQAEMTAPIFRMASNSRRFMLDFLEERRAALTYIANRESYEDLCDSEKLNDIFLNMNQSFGGLADLGVIDSDGNQRSYAGRYALEGKNYREQEWFQKVARAKAYVSEVFLGHRNVPHFVIAVRKSDAATGTFHILRATIDTALLNRYMDSLDISATGDVFLVNRNGLLQTPSRGRAGILDPCPIPMPPFSSKAEILEVEDKRGRPRLVGYAYIEQSPFVFVVLADSEDIMGSWLHLRRRILWLLGISIGIIMAVILWSSTYLVKRVRDADYKRNEALHNMEYNNKMASIGRMAAGVAHEINNPLAIISENAGLLKDLVVMEEKPPEEARLLKIVETVLNSVDRCSAITHRLLGFAKRMDPLVERIALVPLIDEVLSFQGKEAEYRSITITVDAPDDLPTIESDRGQLQQVFLNILSNALAAVDDGGRIDTSLKLEDGDTVAVRITDDGPGIPEEDLDRIFEPFFSTKSEYGTGLGLSITFGIVEKLGGRIDVQSKVGEGASFTVRLPVARRSLA